MRKILFRGKRADNSKWVYGYYVFDPQEEIHQIYSINHHATGVDFLVPFGVNKETVGQYTGLKDKNGERVFEGDIIKLHNDNYYVYFSDTTLGFDWCNISGSREEPFVDDYYLGEIIGNIYDNPELLKGD